MSLADIFRKALGSKYTTADALAAEYPDGVTIIGFKYVEVKGNQIASYRVAEGGGQSFLASGKCFNDLTADLEEIYGDAAQIDATLKAEPQRIKIHPITNLPNGRKFRLVEPLDEVIDVDTGEIRD